MSRTCLGSLAAEHDARHLASEWRVCLHLGAEQVACRGGRAGPGMGQRRVSQGSPTSGPPAPARVDLGCISAASRLHLAAADVRDVALVDEAAAEDALAAPGPAHDQDTARLTACPGRVPDVSCGRVGREPNEAGCCTGFEASSASEACRNSSRSMAPLLSTSACGTRMVGAGERRDAGSAVRRGRHLVEELLERGIVRPLAHAREQRAEAVAVKLPRGAGIVVEQVYDGRHLERQKRAVRGLRRLPLPQRARKDARLFGRRRCLEAVRERRGREDLLRLCHGPAGPKPVEPRVAVRLERVVALVLRGGGSAKQLCWRARQSRQASAQREARRPCSHARWMKKRWHD